MFIAPIYWDVNLVIVSSYLYIAEIIFHCSDYVETEMFIVRIINEVSKCCSKLYWRKKKLLMHPTSYTGYQTQSRLSMSQHIHHYQTTAHACTQHVYTWHVSNGNNYARVGTATKHTLRCGIHHSSRATHSWAAT